MLPALLAVALLMAGCRREPQFARVDAALAPLIPSDTVALACLRLDRLKASPFSRQFVEQTPLPFLTDLQKQTGLDPRRDIWELVWAIRSEGRAPLVFIRGKFGGEFGFEPEIKDPMLRRMNYKGYYMFGAGNTGVLFMNTGAALTGRIDDLQAVIDNRDKSGERAPQELLNLVGTLPGTSEFWLAAVNGEAALRALPAFSGMGGGSPDWQGAKTLTGSGQLANGVQLEFDLQLRDATSAQSVAGAVAGLHSLARGPVGVPGANPGADVSRGIQAQSSGAAVRILVKKPLEEVPSLLRLLRQ